MCLKDTHFFLKMFYFLCNRTLLLHNEMRGDYLCQKERYRHLREIMLQTVNVNTAVLVGTTMLSGRIRMIYLTTQAVLQLSQDLIPQNANVDGVFLEETNPLT